MKRFDLIAFDIDGTLTRSKLPIDREMAEFLCRLMDKYMVAIISGADFKQFRWQILDHLSCLSDQVKNLYLLPVDGTVFCRYDNGWQCRSDDPLSPREKKQIKTAFENIFEISGLDKPERIYGELIEDRGAQLNFSALGQDAPITLKEKWDSDNKKREKMIRGLQNILPDFSMRVGGTTSIEITKTGIDKAYGLARVMKYTGISKEGVLYLGDKLFKGGNDEPVLTLGLESMSVKGPEETKKLILELLE